MRRPPHSAVLSFGFASGACLALLLALWTAAARLIETPASAIGCLPTAPTGFCATQQALTNAQILALPTTPVDLLAATGSGYRNAVIAASIHTTATSGAYTNINATKSLLEIWYTSGSTDAGLAVVNDTGATGATQITTILGTAQETIVTLPMGIAQSSTGAYVLPKPMLRSEAEAKAVQIRADNNGSGNFTGGNVANSLKVTLYFAVEPF